jgi:hypothetical protein
MTVKLNKLCKRDDPTNILHAIGSIFTRYFSPCYITLKI